MRTRTRVTRYTQGFTSTSTRRERDEREREGGEKRRDRSSIASLKSPPVREEPGR